MSVGTDVEVAVLGAGPVGSLAALLLADAGRSVALIGPGESRASAGPRPIALSHASRLLLERAGVWPALDASPIRRIEVSQEGAFGRTRIEAEDAGVPALGYVVPYGVLADALARAIDERSAAPPIRRLVDRGDAPRAADAGFVNLEYGGEAGRLRQRARLAVHAEGVIEDAIEVDYGQTAIVARLDVEPLSGDIAFERFTSAGPLALLPLAGGFALVWAQSPVRAAALLAADEGAFIEELSQAAGGAAGRIRAVHDRTGQPLHLKRRRARVARREIWIGNSAQTLHPVAGQGMNLGFRDAYELARVVGEAPDPGEDAVVAGYERCRSFDAVATARATDVLARAFTGRNPLTRAARGLALASLDLAPPARRFFARRMIFGLLAIP